ncbi:MAG: 30S ribosome-binding factor RbfA [Deltaproteobacteria bacterium]|nr:30S ribosome-binding factor RbfA [Deltaproteobacteria bacterium]
MDYQRSERVGDLLIEVIAEVLREEIRDPRVAAVTITASKVSKDLRQARVYFTILGGSADDKDAVLAGLKSATGFIRSRAGKQLKLRYVPTLEFFYDQSADEAQRIDDLLKRVK